MTNLEDVLTEISLVGSRGMAPRIGLRMPASDRSRREQYPSSSTLLAITTRYNSVHTNSLGGADQFL